MSNADIQPEGTLAPLMVTENTNVNNSIIIGKPQIRLATTRDFFSDTCGKQ
jgi:hypothetical protein